MRHVTMKALRKTVCCTNPEKMVGLYKLPETHLPSAQEPSLPSACIPQYLGFHQLTSRIQKNSPPSKSQEGKSTNPPASRERKEKGSHGTTKALGKPQFSFTRTEQEKPTKSRRMEARTSHTHFLFFVAVCLPFSTAKSGPHVGSVELI